jgi:hypothetical protein
MPQKTIQLTLGALTRDSIKIQKNIGVDEN